MNKVAIIPARGGSKRIPRKNIKLFAGKPIIAWSIEAAKTSGLFDRIIVSTDDKEIASVAKDFGAEVPFLRPTELADNYTGTNAVIKHSLQWLAEHNFPVKYACCIYATAPFIKIEYLRQGLELLIKSDKSFSFPVTSFPFPIQRAIRINKNNCAEAIYPENIFARSQDFEATYHDAGQFYWGRPEAFLNDVVMFSPESVVVVLPRHIVQDIDTMEDWFCAEQIFSVMHKNSLINACVDLSS